MSRTKRSRKRLVWKKAGGLCAHCGCRPGNQLNITIDHFIPISKGGGYDLRNLMPLCKKCNNERLSDDIDPAEFYKYANKQAISDCYEYRKEFELKW